MFICENYATYISCRDHCNVYQHSNGHNILMHITGNGGETNKSQLMIFER